MFVENSWYVAALGREIDREPLARIILGQPIVFYRTEDGTAIALEDRCCHRHLPLSKGKVVGDCLQCGYHGLRFDGSGTCVEIPGEDSVPPSARIRSYPMVEHRGWLWIWMGEPAAADASKIPDWWWMQDDEWACVLPEPLYIKCNYQLVNDNLLDVTHLAYIHATSIGNSAITEFPIEVEREDGLVRMSRWILDRPPPPLYQSAGGFTGNVDRWQIVEHVAPCFTINHAGCIELDAEKRRVNGGKTIQLKALSAPTPETEDTTHYFFAFVRAFGLDDPAMHKMIGDDFVAVFREDVDVLEAQQEMMNLRPDAPHIDIKVDAAPLAARRMHDRMMRAET